MLASIGGLQPNLNAMISLDLTIPRQSSLERE